MKKSTPKYFNSRADAMSAIASKGPMGGGGNSKVKGATPATSKGKAMVAKLGRTKKTGGFAKIAAKAGKKYGSKVAGKKVAASIFWKMAGKKK